MDAPKRKRVKTLAAAAALAAVVAGAFIAGVLANRVPVLNVQSIAGNRVLVPNADVIVVDATWSLDPKASLVTDVDLLIWPNGPVLDLKRFDVFVQVSCLDETVTPPKEFICSTGRGALVVGPGDGTADNISENGAVSDVVLPTRNAGMYLVRVILDPPVNPELTEIHDLSFIVTDTKRGIVGPPSVFCGVTDGGGAGPSFTVSRGGTTTVNLACVGVLGVPNGTMVRVTATDLPPGVQTEIVQLELRSTAAIRHPYGMATLTFTANGDAQAGHMTSRLHALGDTSFTTIDSFFDVFVELSLNGANANQ